MPRISVASSTEYASFSATMSRAPSQKCISASGALLPIPPGAWCPTPLTQVCRCASPWDLRYARVTIVSGPSRPWRTRHGPEATDSPRRRTPGSRGLMKESLMTIGKKQRLYNIGWMVIFAFGLDIYWLYTGWDTSSLIFRILGVAFAVGAFWSMSKVAAAINELTKEDKPSASKEPPKLPPGAV
jgi:hypothetical protein